MEQLSEYMPYFTSIICALIGKMVQFIDYADKPEACGSR